MKINEMEYKTLSNQFITMIGKLLDNGTDAMYNTEVVTEEGTFPLQIQIRSIDKINNSSYNTYIN